MRSSLARLRGSSFFRRAAKPFLSSITVSKISFPAWRTITLSNTPMITFTFSCRSTSKLSCFCSGSRWKCSPMPSASAFLIASKASCFICSPCLLMRNTSTTASFCVVSSASSTSSSKLANTCVMSATRLVRLLAKMVTTVAGSPGTLSRRMPEVPWISSASGMVSSWWFSLSSPSMAAAAAAAASVLPLPLAASAGAATPSDSPPVAARRGRDDALLFFEPAASRRRGPCAATAATAPLQPALLLPLLSSGPRRARQLAALASDGRRGAGGCGAAQGRPTCAVAAGATCIFFSSARVPLLRLTRLRTRMEHAARVRRRGRPLLSDSQTVRAVSCTTDASLFGPASRSVVRYP
mmetsp:Transcript_13609/g.49475  ORF Transcript_13609/g.49475 Transcript_13609/m.49475 type:complete len:353 (-) Transcript_13609:70-1128(-)